MLDEMCAALGGRAAEDIVFGEVSTGALSDLEKVTKQAYSMVSIYGLNEAIGNISFYDSSGQSDYSFQRPYSEKTAELIDTEVKQIVDDAYKRTIELLKANRTHLNQLAEFLLEKEVIFKEDMEKIFGKRPFHKEEAPLIHEGDERPEAAEKLPEETASVESNDLSTSSEENKEAPTPNPQEEDNKVKE